jgi:NADH-quinone oxidoreductase subunit K
VTIGLGHFVAVSALLFSLGLYCLVTRRNAVAILMGIELILNAALLNLAAFSRYVHHAPDGQIFAVFGIVLAAAEAVVALALVLQFYRAFRSVDTTEAPELKG